MVSRSESSSEAAETRVEAALVHSLRDELDAGQPGTIAELLAAVEAGASQVIVDMVDVTFIDSSVVRALLIAQRATTEAGGWLRLAYTHHVIARVIEICRLTDVLPQHPSVEAARRGAARVRPAERRAVEEKGQPR